MMFKRWLKTFLKNSTKASIILILVGSLVWSVTMVKSGLAYPFGMGFWGPNGHDGVWHIAVIESLAGGSWNIPIFAGETIRNYHIGFDLLLAWIHKLTFIPTVNLYYQIVPPILALSIGIFAYFFVYTWRKSKIQAFWATFFIYFGGSFGWLITLIRNRQIGGESLFWSQQSISTLINPPFALSILVILLALNLLLHGLAKNGKSKKKKLLTTATFLFGILIQIKVYAGLLVLGGLFVAGVWRMFKRQGLDLIKVFTGSLIVSILLFYPINKSGAGNIIFQPFWFLESMMAAGDRLNWPKFAEAMLSYKAQGVIVKGALAYFGAFLIFLVGNFGTRVVSFPLFIKKAKKLIEISYMDVFICAVTAAGIVLPTFFLQRGTAWNTLQFMYYSLFFSGILAGVWLGSLIKNKKLPVTMIYIIVTLIVLFTIPTTIGTLKHYLPGRPPAKISTYELEALRFLSKQPEGIVLTQPFDRDAAVAASKFPPRSLYQYESSAYVSAFSRKPVFLEDEVNLTITGYDWVGRRQQALTFFEKPTNKFLSENNISYLYFIKRMGINNLNNLDLEKLFENEEVDIFGLK